MRLIGLFVIGTTFLFSATAITAQSVRLPSNFSWEISNDKFIPQEGLESHICGGDEIGNMVCLEFVWRERNLELYTWVALLADEHRIFCQGMVPEFIIDGEKQGLVNEILETDRFLGATDFPYKTDGRLVYWRIAVGQPAVIGSREPAAFYRLFHAKTLAIRYYFEDDETVLRLLPTENLAEGLEAIWLEAAAMRPANSGEIDKDE